MSVFNRLKIKLLALFDKLGYVVINKNSLKPIDQRELANNPKSLHYYSYPERKIIIEVNLKDGRGLEIFSLAPDSLHPFIFSVKEALNTSDRKASIRKVLDKYYQSVMPQNASEWLGLNPNEVPQLDKEPAWNALLPWENSNIDMKKIGREKCAIYDNKEHEKAYSIEKGWRNFGPVSPEILDLEANRLFRLMLSIQEKGYLRDDNHGGDIGGIILINENNEYRWLVEWGGQHRAAVLSALNYEKIPIKVWQIVDRRDVEVWPCVQSKIYSKEAALKVFDNIYNAHPFENIYNNWIN